MGRYLRRKVIVYLITFVLAVTINWIIPRAMPGDPIQMMLARFQGSAESMQAIRDYYESLFGLDKPVLQQYLNYWLETFRGNFGRSITFGLQPVGEIMKGAFVYDLVLMFPALILSFFVGNRLGAWSGVNKKVDNALMPGFYFLTSAPYFWYAVILSYLFAMVLGIFPLQGAYGSMTVPSLSLSFILDFLHHWFLPFLSLFSIMLGQWAIGMRNMIIYEMGTGYSRYMEAQGSSERLIRRYAYRNGVLPQVTGLAIRLGQFLFGALATEIVFSYPGLGYLLFQSITNNDYFLIQGCFFFIVIFMLIANFVIDIIYMFIDPRVKVTYAGEGL